MIFLKFMYFQKVNGLCYELVTRDLIYQESGDYTRLNCLPLLLLPCYNKQHRTIFSRYGLYVSASLVTPHGGPAIASNHYYTSMQHDQVIEQLSASNTDIIQVTDHSNIMWNWGGGGFAVNTQSQKPDVRWRQGVHSHYNDQLEREDHLAANIEIQ